MSKNPKQKGLKPQEIAELIIEAIVAVAALITALKSKVSTRGARAPAPFKGKHSIAFFIIISMEVIL